MFLCKVPISVLPWYQLLGVPLPGKRERSRVCHGKVNTAQRQLALRFAAPAQTAGDQLTLTL